MTKLQAAAGYIFIEPVTQADVERGKLAASAAKLLMPEPKHQGIPDRGYIRNIGPSVEIEAQVGDLVVIKIDEPNAVIYEDEKYLAVTADQILARLS